MICVLFHRYNIYTSIRNRELLLWPSGFRSRCRHSCNVSCSCNSDSTPNLRISTCHRCSYKNKNKIKWVIKANSFTKRSVLTCCSWDAHVCVASLTELAGKKPPCEEHQTRPPPRISLPCCGCGQRWQEQPWVLWRVLVQLRSSPGPCPHASLSRRNEPAGCLHAHSHLGLPPTPCRGRSVFHHKEDDLEEGELSNQRPALL